MIMAFERADEDRSTKNVEFLINQVVGGRRAKDIDFIFVDTSKKSHYKCFPQLPNVLYVHRERVGFDICSYKVGLAIAPPRSYKYRGQGRYHLGMGQFVLRRDSRFWSIFGTNHIQVLGGCIFTWTHLSCFCLRRH